MGTFSRLLLLSCPYFLILVYSQFGKCHWEPLRCLVVHLVSRPVPFFRSGNYHLTRRCRFTSRGCCFRNDRSGSYHRRYRNRNVCNSPPQRKTHSHPPSIGTNLAAYQAEVSSPLIRGRVVSFVQLSYQVGVLISYCVGLGTVKIPGENSWRTATALQIIPGAILIIASFTIPESPRWMLERHPDRPEKVLSLLSRLRKAPEDDPEVQEEFMDLVASHKYRMEHEGAYTWRRFFTTYGVWKRIAYGMATMALGQISGVGALMLYGVLIFQGLGFSSQTESLLLNVVSGLLCLTSTLITTGGVDKWGRKITLIVGSATMVVSYVIIGALADAYPATTHFNTGAAVVQLIFIYVIEMVRLILSLLASPNLKM